MSSKRDVEPITYLKSRTAELVLDVAESGRPVTMTQNGTAKVVVRDVATYDRWWAALLGRLRRRVGAVTTTPIRGRVVPELAFFGILALREVVERPHRIIYRVAGRMVLVLVLVLDVLDGRRELEDVLLERLTSPPEH